MGNLTHAKDKIPRTGFSVEPQGFFTFPVVAPEIGCDEKWLGHAGFIEFGVTPSALGDSLGPFCACLDDFSSYQPLFDKNQRVDHRWRAGLLCLMDLSTRTHKNARNCSLLESVCRVYHRDPALIP